MPLIKSRPSPEGVPSELTMRYTLFAFPPIAVLSARCGERSAGVRKRALKVAGRQKLTGQICALGVSSKVTCRKVSFKESHERDQMHERR